MNLLIELLVDVLIGYIIYWIVVQIPMPQPVRMVILGIFAILAISFLLNLGGYHDRLLVR